MKKSQEQHKDAVLNFSEHKRKRVDSLENDLDALFRLPPAEFTGARNELAAGLKKSGRRDEAARVKALAKPSISAWAVNQLYWRHREAFDQLIASAERFRKVQASPKGGKIADMRTALDARREALTHLSDLATSLLRDAGQNPSPDTIHRITTTLEGISAYASRRDGPPAGRLTQDVDPPGFESLASFVPGTTKQEAVGRRQSAGRIQEAGGGKQVQQLEERRTAKIADAKVSLQNAKRSLTQARARAQSLEAAQKKTDAEAKKAEKQRRDAEENLANAKTASEAAARRARTVAVEVQEAAHEVKDAERALAATSKELESLFGNHQ
ncbi:MAG TPA: hypothetical protein DC047_02960 [Blastocatellia bacterium]|nr:hypothetical protein [Blastocatellia bacterium]